MGRGFGDVVRHLLGCVGCVSSFRVHSLGVFLAGWKLRVESLVGRCRSLFPCLCSVFLRCLSCFVSWCACEREPSKRCLEKEPVICHRLGSLHDALALNLFALWATLVCLILALLGALALQVVRGRRGGGRYDLVNARHSTQALSPAVSRKRIARIPLSLTVMASSTSSTPPFTAKTPLALVSRGSDANGVGVGFTCVVLCQLCSL